MKKIDDTFRLGAKARKTQKSLFWYNIICNEYESVFDRLSMKSAVDMVWNVRENRTDHSGKTIYVVDIDFIFEVSSNAYYVD